VFFLLHNQENMLPSLSQCYLNSDEECARAHTPFACHNLLMVLNLKVWN